LKQIERATALTQAISGGSALSMAAFGVRDALRRANEEYSKALRIGDADVFVRRYPQLFGSEAAAAIAVGEHPDAGAEEMVQEMRAEHEDRPKEEQAKEE
jgi:hypothetical protein